ncbi:MAG: acyl-CoA N-acyltransferase [Benniella sp.]|nr:MAG: acyl-CoA N-acyltransferase [Benniella sp.]
MEGLKQFNNNSISFNFPLDSYASSPVSRTQEPNILAVCITDKASSGQHCYVYSTCLSGRRACEPSRRAGVSEEQTALFVREVKQFRSSAHDDAVHPPTDRLEMEAEELKDVKIDAKLTITSNDSKMNTWYGFVSEGALFLKGNGWDDMDIRESVVAALDLAEEQLGCQTVYLCLEKSNLNLTKLVRTLMYAGFEMVHPSVLPHADPKYLVLGMDL